MGWGEPHRSHVDVPHSVWDAATNLANRVREWNQHRTVANEERMVVALSIYDSATYEKERERRRCSEPVTRDDIERSVDAVLDRLRFGSPKADPLPPS